MNLYAFLQLIWSIEFSDPKRIEKTFFLLYTVSHRFFSYLQALHSAFSISIYLDLEFPLMHELISIYLGALGFPSSKVGLTIKGIELFRL